MYKLLFAFGLSLMFTSCGNEPKLSKEENNAVEEKMADDQRAMDSLEKAIQAQIDALDKDSIQ